VKSFTGMGQIYGVVSACHVILLITSSATEKVMKARSCDKKWYW